MGQNSREFNELLANILSYDHVHGYPMGKESFYPTTFMNSMIHTHTAVGKPRV